MPRRSLARKTLWIHPTILAEASGLRQDEWLSLIMSFELVMLRPTTPDRGIRVNDVKIELWNGHERNLPGFNFAKH